MIMFSVQVNKNRSPVNSDSVIESERYRALTLEFCAPDLNASVVDIGERE